MEHLRRPAMKLIRCAVPPFMMEQIVDALKAHSDVESLMVMSEGGWNPRQKARTEIYRGRKYQARLNQEIAIDVTVADCAVDDVVRIVADMCHSAGAEVEARILVMPVEHWH